VSVVHDNYVVAVAGGVAAAADGNVKRCGDVGFVFIVEQVPALVSTTAESRADAIEGNGVGRGRAAVTTSATNRLGENAGRMITDCRDRARVAHGHHISVRPLPAAASDGNGYVAVDAASFTCIRLDRKSVV